MDGETTTTTIATPAATDGTNTGATAAEQNTAEATAPQTGETTTEQTETTPTDFEALIQRAVDRATNKLGNENKKLRGQIDELRKTKLSDDELKQLEIQEKELAITEREQRLQEKENRLFAIKAIKEAGLDDGSESSLALVDFVMGENEDTIKERVTAFGTLVKRFVQAEVDRTFKANGRTPGVGTGAPADKGQADSVAVQLGRNIAKANQAAQSTLDFYLGGNKK